MPNTVRARRIWFLIKSVIIAVVTCFFIAAAIIYGLSVYLENNILTVSKDARTLDEDNRNLQTALDNMESYEKIEAESKSINQLAPPKEVLTLRTDSRPTLSTKLVSNPYLSHQAAANSHAFTPAHTEAYGY